MKKTSKKKMPKVSKKSRRFYGNGFMMVAKKYKKPIVFGALSCLLLMAGIVAFLFTSLPSPRRLESFPYPESTLIYDRNDNLLYEIHGDTSRISLSLDKIPDHFIKATLAIEDRNFYSHHGFDLKGIARAFYNTIVNRKLQGGSTLTQQLVKNALLTPERTMTRKVKEAALTLMTELLYSKDKIFEMYLNQTPYGGTSWGVQAAAKTYFNKDAQELDLAESALIAGLPASPTRYSPFIHPDEAKARQELVLRSMVESGYINQEEYDQAVNQELKYASPGAKIKAPHFVFYVKEQLVERYGQVAVAQGGFKIKTTLDLSVQEMAQSIVASEVAKLTREKVTNGAVLVTNPNTGEILAMVGSKDYFAQDIDGKYNVTTASRQPGSSIKPLNYAVGIETGKVTAATVFNDIYSCFPQPGNKPYCPKNYDNTFHGPVNLRTALASSYNVPAVKMLKVNTLETFIASASAMGIDTFKEPSNYGLSLTLGGGEVKMTGMATAFGVLANTGEKKSLVSILEVKDRNGRVLDKFEDYPGEQILSPETTFIVTNILSDNSARMPAFGSRSELVVKDHPEVAVKTGTTNDLKDNWTIGYTPSFVVVVWVGNNNNTSMSYVASGVTGASPIWNKVMTQLLEEKPQEYSPQPSGVVGMSVCNLTGALPSEEGCSLRYEYFIKGKEPKRSQTEKKIILINADNGKPVQPGENIENIKYEEHMVISDPTGSIYCLDCPIDPDQVST